MFWSYCKWNLVFYIYHFHFYSLKVKLCQNTSGLLLRSPQEKLPIVTKTTSRNWRTGKKTYSDIRWSDKTMCLFHYGKSITSTQVIFVVLIFYPFAFKCNFKLSRPNKPPFYFQSMVFWNKNSEGCSFLEFGKNFIMWGLERLYRVNVLGLHIVSQGLVPGTANGLLISASSTKHRARNKS